jgi:hypothetical protein
VAAVADKAARVSPKRRVARRSSARRRPSFQRSGPRSRTHSRVSRSIAAERFFAATHLDRGPRIVERERIAARSCDLTEGGERR